jgi:hypothetical protein
MKYQFVPTFILCGLAWITRATINLYKHNYWDPQTALDYAAVIVFSFALLLLAVSLGDLYRRHPLPDSRKQQIWRAGMFLAIAAATVVGIENFVEDWLDVDGIGFLFPVGMLALFLGLLIAGMTAFFLPEIRRRLSWALLVIGFGVASIEVGGGFLTGAVFLVLPGWLRVEG